MGSMEAFLKQIVGPLISCNFGFFVADQSGNAHLRLPNLALMERSGMAHLRIFTSSHATPVCAKLIFRFIPDLMGFQQINLPNRFDGFAARKNNMN